MKNLRNMVVGDTVIVGWDEDGWDDEVDWDEDEDDHPLDGYKRGKAADIRPFAEALKREGIKFTSRGGTLGFHLPGSNGHISAGVWERKGKKFIFVEAWFYPNDYKFYKINQVASILKDFKKYTKHADVAKEKHEEEMKKTGIISIEFASLLGDWKLGSQGGTMGEGHDTWYRLLQKWEDKIPSRYRKGGKLYRSMEIKSEKELEDFISGKKKFRTDKISSWARTAKAADYFVTGPWGLILRKDIPDSQVFINVDDYFTKGRMKLLKRDYGLNISIYAGQEDEVICKNVQMDNGDIVAIKRRKWMNA